MVSLSRRTVLRQVFRDRLEISLLMLSGIKGILMQI